jgi:hypothetical protein
MAHCRAAVESRHSAGGYVQVPGDFSNAAEWDPGVLAGEQPDPGPVRPGSRFRAGGAVPWRRMSLTHEVIGFVPDREVLLAAANDVLRSTDRIVVTGCLRAAAQRAVSSARTRCCRARR